MQCSHNPDFRRPPLLRWWGLQLLTTTAFALMVAGRYFGVADVDEAPGSLAFRAIMLVAHFTALSAIFLGPSLTAIVLRAPAWIVIPLGTLCSIGMSMSLLIDTQVYQLYRFHIHAGVMNLLLGGAVRETFAFFGFDVCGGWSSRLDDHRGLIAVAFLCWRYVVRSPGHPRLARAVTMALLASIVTFHGLHIWADAQAREALLEQTDVLPFRYAATAKRALRSLGVNVRSHPLLTPSPAEDRNSLAYPLYPLNCRPKSTLPNIVFIVIDSWRFDELDAQVTPISMRSHDVRHASWIITAAAMRRVSVCSRCSTRSLAPTGTASWRSGKDRSS